MPTNVRTSAGGTATFQLRKAILIYEGREGAYATLHDIERHRPGGPRLAPGTPATREACAAFTRTIAERAAFDGFLSNEMLFIGPRVIAWWRPPGRARMFFETVTDDDEAATLGQRAGVVPQPGLVFMLVDGREWFVFAVKGADRPLSGTRLFKAPYFNVYDKGNICEGNIRRPSRVTPDTIRGFESAFFDSRFTHPNAQRLTNYRPRGKKKPDVYALWRDLLDRKLTAFPEASLVPHGRHTLESRLRDLEKGSE